MGTRYGHLSSDERGVIMAEQRRGASGAQIARLLGRCWSTISRELVRNGSSSAYSVRGAGARYRDRRHACRRRKKLVEGTPLFGPARDRLLYRYWSPQQIAATLRTMHPDDPSWQGVSHETIYAAIYAHPKGALRQEMIAAPRQAKSSRVRPRKTAARRGGLNIPEDIEIKNRPEDIATRRLPGHWDGDFIKGASNRSAIGTLVERKTRFVVLCKMRDCMAESALESFHRQMKKIPAFLLESMTYHRGSEMARHEELARRLNIDIWFADPYKALAAWQQREYQRPAAPVPAQRHRPVGRLADPTQRHRQAAQRTPPPDPGLENPRAGTHRRNRSLPPTCCT